MKYGIPFTDNDERDCIRKAQARDKDSFGQLIEKYAGLLKGFCIRDLGCGFDAAEDIAQEAFYRAWKSLGSFNHDAKFSTWLCAIARNHYLNMRKDRDNTSEEFKDGLHHQSHGQTDTLAMQDCVQRQLAKIREEHRHVIDLVHLRGMSYQHAAQLLKSPLGTVKKRLHIALKAAGPLLRECL